MPDDVPIDDGSRDPPGCYLQYATAGAHPVAVKTFISPAECMRGQDHVLERQERVLGVDRFGLEDVQAGPLNRTALERLGQSRLVDDGPPGDINDVGIWFHQGEPPGIDQVAS